EQRFGERVEPGARPLAADALQADARALDQEEELVGDALGPGVSRLAHQGDQALALAALVRFDDPARRVLALGELDRRVGERAAAASGFGGELRHLPKEKAQLGIGVARMLRARRLPYPFTLGRELLQVGADQLVARAEMPVERHLVGA